MGTRFFTARLPVGGKPAFAGHLWRRRHQTQDPAGARSPVRSPAPAHPAHRKIRDDQCRAIAIAKSPGILALRCLDRCRIKTPSFDFFDLNAGNSRAIKRPYGRNRVSFHKLKQGRELPRFKRFDYRGEESGSIQFFLDCLRPIGRRGERRAFTIEQTASGAKIFAHASTSIFSSDSRISSGDSAV